MLLSCGIIRDKIINGRNIKCDYTLEPCHTKTCLKTLVDVIPKEWWEPTHTWTLLLVLQWVHVSASYKCFYMHLDLIVPLVMLKVFIMVKYFISFQFWQFLLLEVIFGQDWFRISKMENNFHNVLHRPGIEPGSRRWQAESLPLSYIPGAKVGHEWYWFDDWPPACQISTLL